MQITGGHITTSTVLSAGFSEVVVVSSFCKPLHILRRWTRENVHSVYLVQVVSTKHNCQGQQIKVSK